MVRQASSCAAPYCAFSDGMPADGGRIEKNVRAREARKARGFRIPLIPADQHAEAAEARVEIQEAEIAGREIKLLEVQRIVGNMHLAIDAFDLAIGADHRRRVVIQAGATPLEQRRDDHDPEFARQAPERFRGRSGNRLGQRKQLRVFFAAEILRAEQLLQADDLRASRRPLRESARGLSPGSRSGPARSSSAPGRHGTFPRSDLHISIVSA